MFSLGAHAVPAPRDPVSIQIPSLRIAIPDFKMNFARKPIPLMLRDDAFAGRRLVPRIIKHNVEFRRV